MKANQKNQFGQPIQNGDSRFTSFFRFWGLLCPFLRCVKKGAKQAGWRYLTYFGAVFLVRSSSFGLCFK